MRMFALIYYGSRHAHMTVLHISSVIGIMKRLFMQEI